MTIDEDTVIGHKHHVPAHMKLPIYLSDLDKEYQSAILTFPDMVKRMAELEARLARQASLDGDA